MKLEVAGNARIQTLPAGSGTDDVVTTDANGNLRKMPASTFTGATGPQGPAGPQGATGPAGSNATADGDAWAVTGEDQTSAIGRTGNIGIGTTSPAAKLHVQRAGIGQIARMDMSDGVTGSPTLMFETLSNTNGGAFKIQSVRMGLAEDAPLVLNPVGGNVGIGTASPLYRLHVDGRLAVGTTAPGTWSTNGSDILLNTGVANSLILLRPNGDGSSVNQFLVAPDGHSFYGSDGFEKVRINQLGNVGIGTPTPGAKLHVNGGIFSSSDGITGLLAEQGGYAGLSAVGTGNQLVLNYLNNNMTNINWASSGHVIMVAGGATGNVGIGTTNPATKLDVNGIIRSNDYFLGWDQGNNQVANSSYPLLVASNGAGIYQDKGSSNNVGGLSFYTHTTVSTPVKRMTLTPEGNVGIGTTTPTEKLVVAGNGLSLVPNNSGNTTTGYAPLLLKNTAGNNVFKIQQEFGTDDNSVFFLTDNADNGATESVRMAIRRSSGNVGINTSSPTSRLEVNGSATNTAANVVTGTTIDFSLSNLAATNNSGTAITLSNIKNGGAYTLALTSTSATGSVTFSSAGFTFVYVGTAARTSGKKHIYNFIVIGTEVYVTMGTEN